MDFQPPRHDSVESEALQPTEAAILEPSRPLPQPYLSSDDSPLLHYLRVLKKRRWIVLSTTAIVFSLAVIATLKTIPLYQASSKVAIFPETPNVLGFKNFDENSTDYQYDVALETQAAILRSDALAMQVIQGMRAATLAPHRISLVFDEYEDCHTSRMSNGDLMWPALMSSPNAHCMRSSSIGKYCIQRIG